MEFKMRTVGASNWEFGMKKQAMYLCYSNQHC